MSWSPVVLCLLFPMDANVCIYHCKRGGGGVSDLGVQNKIVFLPFKSSNIT